LQNKAMRLDHSELPSIEPALERNYRLVFEGGMDALQKAGLLNRQQTVVEVIRDNPAAFRRFVRGCHYAWDLAQRDIAQLVIEHEQRARLLRKQLKIDLRNRNKAEVEHDKGL